MEYEVDTSGTDDDLPPSHQNRVQRGGRVSGSGRSAAMGSVPYPRMHTDMESQIYHLEQEAYRAVLLAFKAQSDTTITWEKTSLMAELRKELRISEDEHKALLGQVDGDDNLRRIREWRKSGGHQSGSHNTAQPGHDPVLSPTFSASRKKQKLSQSVPSLSLNAPSSVLHTQTVAPSMSVGKRGPGTKGRKPSSQSHILAGITSAKSMPYPSTISSERGQVAHRVSSGALVTNEPAQPAGFDASLIGRKVFTRWPDDNNFYEAFITDFKEGLYALVYDANTPNEAIEWVNFNEISPEDIRWEGGDPGIFNRGGRVGPGHGIKKSVAHSGALPGVKRGRGRPPSKLKKDVPPSQNGTVKKASDNIEILRTDTLIKEVEKIFGGSRPDPLEFEKAKKALKEQEQALVDAIARLAAASDGRDEGERPLSLGPSTQRELG